MTKVSPAFGEHLLASRHTHRNHHKPEANPGLCELLSLSVTFPFNISIGIPIYYSVISRIWG
jgi:hypothetical protein